LAVRLPSGKTWSEILAEEAIIINDFFDEAFTTFKSNYWKGYVPRIYGYGREGVQDVEAKDRYQNALDRADAEGRIIGLTDKELQTRFDGPAPKANENQLKIYKQLTREHALLVDPNATDYEGEVLEQEDRDSLSMWDLNNMILRELESMQRWKAYDTNYDPGSPENSVQLNTIKRLKKVLNRYEFKEWTARSFSRKYREQQTYADVFRESR
jgi:hypothetical protein